MKTTIYTVTVRLPVRVVHKPGPGSFANYATLCIMNAIRQYRTLYTEVFMIEQR